MKRFFACIPLLLILACSNPAEVKKELHVYGNCSMCEKTIEGSLKGVEGISLADWNKKSKKMRLAFDTTKITLPEIKQKIAAVGYDMEDVRAEDTTYESLHHCCQYKRPE